MTLRLCTLSIHQGSQSISFRLNRSQVLCPTAFSRFSSRHSLPKNEISVLYPATFSRFSSTMRCFPTRSGVLCPTAFSRFSNVVVLHPSNSPSFSNLQENLNAYSTQNKPSRFLRAKPYSYELYHDKTFWSISSLPPQLLLTHPLLSRQIHPTSQAKSNPLAFQDHPPQSIQQPIFRVLLKQAIFPRPLPLLQIPILFSQDKSTPSHKQKAIRWHPQITRSSPFIQQPIFRILLSQTIFPSLLPLLHLPHPVPQRQTQPII